MATEEKPEKEDPTDALHLRLEQKKAECARDYDAAMTDLTKQHASAETEAAGLIRLLQSMEPVVDRVLASDEEPSASDRRLCERYMATTRLLQEARQSRRLSYGATDASQPLGGAIGDPS